MVLRAGAAVGDGTRPGAYSIPSYQLALMWRRIAARKGNK
jgi:hypothetical protein